MAEKIINVQAPRGLTRLLYRAPIWLYRLGLGGLMGEKHLLLYHIGRRSGKPRQAVVEIVRHDKEASMYVVASGFGEKSDWFQNLMAYPDVTFQVGHKRIAARAECVPLPQATEILLDYSHGNARGMRAFASMIGYHIANYEEGVDFLIRIIKVVSLYTTEQQER